jgi:hypothetical protein
MVARGIGRILVGNHAVRLPGDVDDDGRGVHIPQRFRNIGLIAQGRGLVVGLGRLYIATWGAGVYRFENGETVSLGYFDPTPLRPAGREAKTIGIPRWELTPDPKSESRTLLGRKVGPAHAEGVFISKEAIR